MGVTKRVSAHAVVYGAVAAAAFLSGCGGGGGKSSNTTNTAQNATFTRAFVPLNDGDKITYLTTQGDGIEVPPYQVAAVVHGPPQLILDVPVPVISVAQSYVSDGVPRLTEYHSTTSTGFADYGRDSFVDTGGYSPVTTPVGSRPLPQTGIASAVLLSTVRYPQSREIPFGLAAGTSTPPVSSDEILMIGFSSSDSFPVKNQTTQTCHFTNLGRETVTVPMGTFSCVKIQAEYDSFAPGTTTYWFAENIGLVKRTEQNLHLDYHNNPVIGKSPDFTDEAVSASIGGKQYP